MADALPEALPRLLQAALARLDECECEKGCLACIHMAGCGEYNEGLEKSAARTILKWLVQGEMPKPVEEVEVKEEERVEPATKRARTEGVAGGDGGGGGSGAAVDLVSEEDEDEWEEAVRVS